MKDIEIAEVANRILHDRFDAAGFKQTDVASETDFDGESIVRVKAYYDRRPIADVREIVQANSAIRSELWKHDDRRFVFLDIDFPGAQGDGSEDDDGLLFKNRRQ